MLLPPVHRSGALAAMVRYLIIPTMRATVAFHPLRSESRQVAIGRDVCFPAVAGSPYNYTRWPGPRH